MSKSIKTFGARGDAVTNDAPAIQRAIDNYYGILTVPPGFYHLGTPLRTRPTTYLQGEGAASRFVGNGIVVGGSLDPQSAWTILRDFVVERSVGAGIQIGDDLQPAYLKMENLRIENCQGAGFHVKRGQQVAAVDCYAWKNQYGWFDENDYLTTTMRVERCHFRESQAHGIDLFTCRSYTFKHCVVEANAGPGFVGRESGYGLTLKDCHFETNCLKAPSRFEVELLHRRVAQRCARAARHERTRRAWWHLRESAS